MVRLLGLCLLLAAISTPSPIQAQSSFDDLASDLAARVIALLDSADAVHVTATSADAEVQYVRDEVARSLTARGIRLTERPDGAVAVTIGCSRNLRERACVARVTKGASDETAIVTRPHDLSATQPATLALEIESIFGQRVAILDVAVAGDRLFVLDPFAVTSYRRSESGWNRIVSRTIEAPRVWPRDLRGRLQVEANALTAFLPGFVCRTTVDLDALACTEERTPWPIGIDNTGLDASHNYFYTPEGLTFFAAAALGPAAGARWLVADRSGELVFLDQARRQLGAVGSGDDVTGIETACAGRHVLVSSAENHADVLRLARIVGRQLVPAASPLQLPGSVTAVWPGSASTAATVVAHDAEADRYEAFHVRVACNR